MKTIVLIYGAIAGTILGAMMLITMPMYNAGTLNMDNGELLGYSTMVMAFALIFFGVKSYRDNQLQGVISFGKAMKMGLLITLVASVIYALAWEVCYTDLGDEFMTKMTENHFVKMKADGATEAEIAESREQWTSFSEMYKNPFIRFGVTLFEPSPVGLLISLLSGFLLRKKNFLPKTEIFLTNNV